MKHHPLAFPAVLLLLSACRAAEGPSAAPAASPEPAAAAPRPEWAIAIHGGAAGNSAYVANPIIASAATTAT